MLTGEPEPSPVCWRASDDPDGTSLRAETWAAAAGGAKLEERRPAAKAVAWMAPLCPMESVAPVPMRSLMWWQ